MESYFERAKLKFENLKNKSDVIVLGIESSCDETSVSVVKNGTELLSNVVSSQIDIHKRFGGVVPEVASRNHVMAIENVFNEAVKEAGIKLSDIDAVAVTYGAGLIGALLVGVNFAKALSFGLDVPLIAVSHIEGHISANYITHKALKPPFICLLVSGGHTALLKVSDYLEHTMLGTTIDDSVGEAFDKVARILGLEYPGGPNVDKFAKLGKSNIEFIKQKLLPLIDKNNDKLKLDRGLFIGQIAGHLNDSTIDVLDTVAQNAENLNLNKFELTEFILTVNEKNKDLIPLIAKNAEKLGLRDCSDSEDFQKIFALGKEGIEKLIKSETK